MRALFAVVTVVAAVAASLILYVVTARWLDIEQATDMIVLACPALSFDLLKLCMGF